MRSQRWAWGQKLHQQPGEEHMKTALSDKTLCPVIDRDGQSVLALSGVTHKYPKFPQMEEWTDRAAFNPESQPDRVYLTW